MKKEHLKHMKKIVYSNEQEKVKDEKRKMFFCSNCYGAEHGQVLAEDMQDAASVFLNRIYDITGEIIYLIFVNDLDTTDFDVLRFKKDDVLDALKGKAINPNKIKDLEHLEYVISDKKSRIEGGKDENRT